MEKETTVKFEDTKDELYTYFGKCDKCEYNNVIKGDDYCGGCGKKIINIK